VLINTVKYFAFDTVLGFQMPKSDAYMICDELIIKINEGQRQGRKLIEQQMLHFDEAKEMHGSLR
jgi:hypothetical protein